MIEIQQDKYLTDRETAVRLDQSVRTNKRWRDDQSGPPYIRLRGRILYREAAIADWLRKQERGVRP